MMLIVLCIWSCPPERESDRQMSADLWSVVVKGELSQEAKLARSLF